MARISVEQKALTDPRFQILASLLNSTRQHALGCMVEVWNECQERESFYLSGDLLDAIFSRADSGLLLARSELAREHKSHGWYIRGSKERTGWLKKRRADGKRGGRPRKTLGLTIGIDKKQRRDNPPTPAPTPALSPAGEGTTTSSNPPQAADLDTLARVKPRNGTKPDPELVRTFGAFYEDYPRHEGKQAALKAWIKLAPDKPVMRAIADDMDARLDDGRWQPDDPERIKFIPLPASYLNGRRWEDGRVS